MVNEFEELSSELLKNPDWIERRKAARALGKSGGKAAVDALRQGLKDRDEEVLQAVIHSLAKVGDLSVAEDLLKPKLLNSHDPNTRWATVLALGRLGDHRIIEPLLNMLDDRDWNVRNAVETVLCQSVANIAEHKDIDAAKHLIRMLSVDNARVHAEILGALGRLKRVSRELLTESLFSQSPRVRRAMAQIVGEIGDDSFVSPLLKLMEDPDREVRLAAVGSLGKLRDPRSIEPLIKRLGDSDNRVCERAIESLAILGRDSVPHLIKALKYSKNRILTKNILKTLGKLKDPRSIVPLVNSLNSSYFVVRRSAVDALTQMEVDVTEELSEVFSFPRTLVAPLVEEMSKTDNLRVKARLIRALGELKDARAMEALRDLLDSRESFISEAAQQSMEKISCAVWARASALMVVGKVGGQRAIQLATDALDDPNDEVKIEAIRALGMLKAQGVTEPLLRALSSPNHFVRRAATRGLGLLSSGEPSVVKAIIALLKEDKVRMVRAEAARALGRLRDPSAIPALIDAMNAPNWSVRQHAENALNNFGKDAVQPLIDSLRSEHLFIRMRSARILGDIAGPEVESHLKDLIEREQNEEALQWAREAIVRLEKRSDR